MNSPVFAGGYTTVSGYGNLATGYGAPLVPMLLFFIGAFAGFCYFNFEKNVLCRLLYPFVVMGIIEFARYFYFTGTHFIIALLVILISVLLSKPKWKRGDN